MFIHVTTGWSSLWLTEEMHIHHLTMIAFVSLKPNLQIKFLFHRDEYLKLTQAITLTAA